MELPKNNVFVVSPEWDLRRNGSRAILLDLDPANLRYVLLSPVDSLIVALFNGERTITNVECALAGLLDVEYPRAAEAVRWLVDKLNGDDTQRLVLRQQLGDADFRTYDPTLFVTRPQTLPHPWRLEVPINIGITLTHRCQTRCRYCYAECRYVAPKDELTVSEWQALIDRAAELGIDRVSLLGGDELARPEALDVLAYLCEVGMQFSISTKCYVNSTMAHRLVDMGIGERIIQISMDSPDPHIADFLVRRRGFYRRSVESLTNLLAVGLKVRAKGVLTSHNVRLAPDLIQLWYGLGVRYMQLVDYSRSYYHHSDDLYVSPDDSAWANEQIRRLQQKFADAEITYGAQSSFAASDAIEKIPDNERWAKWGKRAGCSGGSTSLNVAPDGFVFLCEQIPQTPENFVGDLRHQDVMMVWNSERLLQYIYPDKELFSGTPCYRCEQFDECHRASGHCFRDALFAYGSRYMPPPSCPLAPAGAPRIY